MGNETYLDMVTVCYQRRKVFVGCPLVCHGKFDGELPISPDRFMLAGLDCPPAVFW